MNILSDFIIRIDKKIEEKTSFQELKHTTSDTKTQKTEKSTITSKKKKTTHDVQDVYKRQVKCLMVIHHINQVVLFPKHGVLQKF